ncbi:type I restriction enzyme HsdR N-terminal domain-containing protein [Nostoc sp. WHI]|uniref:type I restriction enzyme HsdR N-terminal domain-containing protein n=1 Tax=Nostoc sp. WHI TaxID=2650611 RepID=UPI0018C7043D|nr:type I restriction enzyme HsdR N-terminal domain-containing protein [Nostoc sp. WHI]MBG1269282.1 type I restriction enzyme HsdR N-terminal domain-containing protein [Nostoc sp. WHI]
MNWCFFRDFDFKLLNSPDFKEDSVREELITPLLHALGYQAQGEFQIIRSKSLLHPFVMIGSKKHKVNIVPDYLLRIKNKFAWVLDAKRPDQNITNSVNCEQVYSYAIHPEIRVDLYALCNGHELVVFHISHIEPIFRVALQDIVNKWPQVEKLLSPYTVFSYRPRPKKLYPDYGIYLYKLGYTDQEIAYLFYEIPIDHIVRVDDQTLSILINLVPDGVEFALSFDFDFENLIELVNLAPQSQRFGILDGLRRQPYQVNIVPPFAVNIEAYLGSLTKTKFEDIMPMIVKKFD